MKIIVKNRPFITLFLNLKEFLGLLTTQDINKYSRIPNFDIEDYLP